MVVAAHYDTKNLPGFVGANDGAGGTAAVLELARALRHTKRPKGAPELRFVLFDGEEATDDDRDFLATGVRGSKAYARRHADELRALVLLDFVAEQAPAASRARRARTRSCGRGCGAPPSASGSAARSRTSCAARSPTTTRRSPPAACPRST